MSQFNKHKKSKTLLFADSHNRKSTSSISSLKNSVNKKLDKKKQKELLENIEKIKKKAQLDILKTTR